MGCHRGETHDACLRSYYRSAVRQRIGGGARRGTYDESVCLVGHQFLTVDLGTYGNHRGVVALQYSNIVQRTRTGLEVVVVSLHLDDGVALYGVTSFEELLDSSVYLVGVDTSKETQTSHVYSDDGYLLVVYVVGTLEESTVATHRDDEVGTEVIPLERRNLLEQRCLGIDAQNEVIELLLYHHLGTTLCQKLEKTEYLCRLFLLVSITKYCYTFHFHAAKIKK